MARIKTIHGVQIPPRKKKPGRKTGARYVTLNFVITGIIPSKKNRQRAEFPRMRIAKLMSMLSNGSMGMPQAIAELKKCKPWIRYTKKFEAWETAKMADIVGQAAVWMERLRKKGHDVVFPISDASISIYHYWKDNNIRDNSNKAETIHDLFVKAGILSDDTWQCLTPNEADANNYAGEILDHITEIQITAYNWIK